MSQEEIIEVLEKHKQLTAVEISKKLNKNVHGVRSLLNKLLRYNEVEKVVLTREEVESMGIKFVGRHLAWKIKKP